MGPVTSIERWTGALFAAAVLRAMHRLGTEHIVLAVSVRRELLPESICRAKCVE